MRSSPVTRILRTGLTALLLAASLLGQAPDKSSGDLLQAARALFRNGEFRGSAVAFQDILHHGPSAEAYAGLVQSYLKLDDVKAAEKNAQEAVAAFPGAAAAHAASGDVYFRRGLVREAEEEYKTALGLDERCARAWLGKGRIESVLAQRAGARQSIRTAHELDPEDGDALYEWAIRLQYPENVAALEKHLAEFRNDEELELHEREYKDLLKALAGRRVWVPARDVDRAEIRLEVLTAGPALATRGYGVRVRLNDRASVVLLLDTGGSGIVISRKLAEKIGARKLSEQSLMGIGKGRDGAGYTAWVDKVVVGGLEFHDCFIHTTPREIAEVDGTIGTDIFSKYLVNLDFPARKLRLEPLPDDPGETRVIAEPLTRAFSLGHLLLVSTDVGKKASGLFVVDSGSNVNTVSNELAKSLPDMRLINLPLSGVGGHANSAFIAEDATLRFGSVRKTGERISSLDLHSVSKNLGIEVSGQIGLMALQEMRVQINYRDGLVAFVKK